MRVFRDGGAGVADDTSGAFDSPSLVEGAARMRANLEPIRSIVAVASARGGTGKSAIVVNLAAVLAQLGRKVGIVDADLNSPSIVAMLGMKVPRRIIPGEGIDPHAGPLGLRIVGNNLLPDRTSTPISFLDLEGSSVPPSNGQGPTEVDYSSSLRHLLSSSRFGTLDLLLIDLPPGVESLARILDIAPRTGLIVVSHPSELSARASKGIFDLAHDRGAAVLGIVENMIGFNCDGCHTVRPLMPQGAVGALASDLGIRLVERLPFDPRFAETSDRGTFFVREYAETPLAKQFIALAQAIDRTGNPRITATASVPG